MRGFTLIEILVVTAVIAILASIATVSFKGLRERQALANGAEETRSLLLRARARTLAAEDDSVYGVHLAVSSIMTFRGSVYSALDPSNEVHELDPLVAISAYSLAGGGDEVVFDKRTGETGDYGTITLALVGDPSRTALITITQTGVVE